MIPLTWRLWFGREFLCKTAAMALFSAVTVLLTWAAPKDRLEILRKLNLPESQGSVPVIYVPAARDRALAYQRSLEDAHAWFEQQLGLKLSVYLAVVDQQTYSKLNDVPWPMPYSDPDQASPDVIVFPSRMEDLIGPETQSKTAGEYVTYHEDGHEFAYALKIRSGNEWVNELVANLFMAAYIDAKRPDLSFVLKGPAADQHPRYTSLADLDYVYFDGVGFQNYVWFQWHLQRIANFLVTGQSFSSVIGKVRTEFPASAHRQETVEQIVARLDHIRPGVREMLGTLAGPTSLRAILPSACTQPPRQAAGVVGVRNESGHALDVVTPDGQSTIAVGGWEIFELKAGESVKLPDGQCIFSSGESALAVIR
jgi:hypothetical protein